MEYIVAVDVGTSSCRAVLFDYNLKEVASANQEYDILSPFPGAAEQNPEEILEAVIKVVRQAVTASGVDRRKVKSISWAAVMHSLIALGTEGQLLTHAWTWADLRSTEQARALEEQGDFFYSRTGCPIHPMYWPAKLEYIRTKMPDVWDKVGKFVSLKEYLLWRITGEMVADHSVASATGIVNTFSLDWDRDILEKLGVSLETLNPTVPPRTILPKILGDYAEKMGLSSDTKVVVGSSDGTLSNLGSGAVRPGVMALMVGTSAAVRVLDSAPKLHAKGSTWCYYIADQNWVIGGATNNGGNVLKWFRDHVSEKTISYQDLSTLAEQSPAGSGGLMFLPFLAGERCPHWNSDARGVFFGLNLSTNRGDMARAMMEGVCFQVYSIYQALTEITGTPNEIRATGGITKSKVWLQIMADIFGKPLSIPHSDEGSAFGAAAMGLIAQGVIPSLADVYPLITVKGIVEPNMDAHSYYTELFEQNRKLYWNLSEQFRDYQEFLRRGRRQ